MADMDAPTQKKIFWFSAFVIMTMMKQKTRLDTLKAAEMIPIMVCETPLAAASVGKKGPMMELFTPSAMYRNRQATTFNNFTHSCIVAGKGRNCA